MQEYFDFLLTACYDCEDDIGLEDISLSEDQMYDLTQDEIYDAYNELCNIYKEAEKEGKGILFTF